MGLFKILFLPLFIMNAALGNNQVKKISVGIDELVTIHTAVGIASIIQLPEAVQTVIIGDQGAFKIEYLDKAITIKPLRFGAKTNLYITTASRRFNVRLVTQNQDSSDYVVYLSSKELKEKSTILWRDFKRTAKSKDLALELKRIGKTKDGFIFVDFTLKPFSLYEKQKADPESFWLTQGKDSKVINSLFLSSQEYDEKHPLQVVMTLNQNDLTSEIPATIEIKGKSNLYIELPKEALWRK